MFKFVSKNTDIKQSKQTFLCMSANSHFALLQFKHKSHYASLGLNVDASPKEIKSAYYKLSLKFHPDRNKGSPESIEKFREIAAAYEVLGNTEKKKNYDQGLKLRYSESEWRRQYYSPRSSDFRSKYYTGQSKYYDYDEHFRKHYEEFDKYRQADYQYFKQRWKANNRRQDPFTNESDWSEYHKRESSKFKRSILLGNKGFIYMMTAWILMFFATLPFVDKDNPKKTAIYYKTTDNPQKSTTIYYKINDKSELTDTNISKPINKTEH